MLGYPGIAVSGSDVVGYIYKAEGEVSGMMKTRYSRGDEIQLGDTITVGPGPSSRMVVIHNYTCKKIKFSGVTVTFKRAYYEPERSPKIEVLKSGCKATSLLVGEKGGMIMRGGTRDASLRPDFLLKGDHSAYDHIELREADNPQNRVVLNIGSKTRLIEWPSNISSLKPATDYDVKIVGKSKAASLAKTIKTASNSGAKKPAMLIVIGLGNGDN